jgi:hypothetical protein
VLQFADIAISQARLRGHNREAGPVFDAIEPFLLNGDGQFAAGEQCG